MRHLRNNMNVSDEKLFESLCSHYKDSYDIHLSTRKEREIIFYALIAITGLFYFQTSDLNVVNTIISDALKETGGITLDKKSGVIPTLIWLILFAVSTKYYQIHTRIEREYAYLHKLEAIINPVYNNSSQNSHSAAFTREGKSYLQSYPLISNVVHYFYNLIFPIIIITAVISRIYKEGVPISYIHSLLGLSILISTSIHIYSMNKDDFKKIIIKMNNRKMLSFLTMILIVSIIILFCRRFTQYFYI